MNKTNLKLLIISLFCVLTLSCANLIKNTGDIALNLPSTTERAAEGDTISYNVIVKKSSSGEVIYKTENAINLVIISDIPADNYIIEITGKNKNYLYTGRTTATVTPGNTTSVNIQLEAERIIKSIDVKLIPSLNHIEIGQLITADLFNITENYPDGTSSIVTNKSDYNIGTEKIDPDQIKCTLTHKKQGISNSVTVPYKSTFPNLTVSLNPTGNIGVAQYSETKELTVTVPTYDTGKYDIAYQWYKADAPIENAVANKFTIPNKVAETVAYTCKVTLTSKSSKVQKTYEPAATANATVEPWKIILTDPAGVSSTDITKLESGKTYTLSLKNHNGAPAVSNLTWYVDSSDGFTLFENDKVKVPTIDVKDKKATITATVGSQQYATRNLILTQRTLSKIATSIDSTYKHVLYNNKIDLSKITIKETYNLGDPVTLTVADALNSGYTMTPDPNTAVTTVGNNDFTIEHTVSGKTATVTIPCKYNFETPTVTISEDTTGDIAQFTGSKKLTATVTFETSALAEQYNLSYQWKKNNLNVGTDSRTIDVDSTVNNDDTGIAFAYNCEVSVTPIESNNCINYTPPVVATAKNDCSVNVKGWAIRFDTPADASTGNLQSGNTYKLKMVNEADLTNSTLTNLTWAVMDASSNNVYSDMTVNTQNEFTVPSSLANDKSVYFVAKNGEQELARLDCTLRKASAPVEVSKETAANFSDLQTAISKLSSSNNNMEITLTGTEYLMDTPLIIGLQEGAYLKGNYKVTLKNSTSEVIMKRTNNNTGAMFTVGNGCELIMSGASESAKIILDGNKTTVTTSTGQLIRSFGNLALTNVNLQNNINSLTFSGSKDKSSYGGAIYLGYEKNNAPTANLNIIMSNCKVSGIESTGLGAIYLHGNKQYNYSASISNCTFDGNSNNQGTLYLQETGDQEDTTNSTITLVGTTISNNSSESLGGGIFLENMNLVLDSSTITSNTSKSNGGGINVKGKFTNITLKNNSSISQNTATGTGGGIQLNAGMLDIIQGSISKNIGSSGANENIKINAQASAPVTVKTVTNNSGVNFTSAKSFANDITQDTDISTAN